MSTKQIVASNEGASRLDAWLWGARFFKTRALAHAAIEAGKVWVDGVRAKPSRKLRCGDELIIGTDRGEFVVVVRDLATRRGSPSVAAVRYEETEASKACRAEWSERRALSRIEAPSERPNTQDRRLLRRLKGQE